MPFSSLPAHEDDSGSAVDPDRMLGEGSCWPGHWAAAPPRWSQPEVRLASIEARARLRDALAELPVRQQLVVALRDVEGLSAAEVCDVLEISEANQRVLLHRGRSALRAVLEEYADG